jgi:hypothetical protein
MKEINQNLNIFCNSELIKNVDSLIQKGFKLDQLLAFGYDPKLLDFLFKIKSKKGNTTRNTVEVEYLN